MKPALLLTLALACAPVPALAQQISGPAVAIDGDTLEMTGFRIRLFGVDAVELHQTCERDGAAWGCGEDAKALLSAFVAGQAIACEQRDTDVYGRVVAVCRAGRLDLSAAMARAGFAVALRDFSEDYLAAADGAKAQRAGIWGSQFAEPAAWRAAHPRVADDAARAERREVAEQREAQRGGGAGVSGGGVYYRNCAAAWAAGAAPIHRGQPGYRPEMDGDNDGIACE